MGLGRVLQDSNEKGGNHVTDVQLQLLSPALALAVYAFLLAMTGTGRHCVLKGLENRRHLCCLALSLGSMGHMGNLCVPSPSAPSHIRVDSEASRLMPSLYLGFPRPSGLFPGVDRAGTQQGPLRGQTAPVT